VKQQCAPDSVFLSGRYIVKQQCAPDSVCLSGRYIVTVSRSPGTCLLDNLVKFFKNHEGTQNVTFYEHYVTISCIECCVV
jgi:hypothetical protein